MKMKAVKGLAVALLTGITMSMQAFAAPVTLPDGTIFDPEYYAEQNPDVVAAVGTDAATLYQHYILFGQKEGRRPYAATNSQTTNQTKNTAAGQRTTDMNAWYAYFSQQWPDGDPEIYRQTGSDLAWSTINVRACFEDVCYYGDYQFYLMKDATSDKTAAEVLVSLHPEEGFGIDRENTVFMVTNPSDAMVIGAAKLLHKVADNQLSPNDFVNILLANGFVKVR